jgi:hypothetical protein
MAEESKAHPNSLKNLKPIKDSNTAREMQLKSAASRKANRAVAARLNKSIKDWNKMKHQLDMKDAPSALDFLKFRMMELISEGNMVEAQELAKELVEFETPKLSRVDQTNRNFNVSDLSDDELEAELIELGVVGSK